jgi:hypothetical protein
MDSEDSAFTLEDWKRRWMTHDRLFRLTFRIDLSRYDNVVDMYVDWVRVYGK